MPRSFPYGHLPIKDTTSFPAPLLAPLAIVVSISCGGAGEAATEGDLAARTDSAGVEIVSSGSNDVVLSREFVPVFTLGSIEGGDDAFFRIADHSIRVSEDGRILVLDVGAKQVLQFSLSGSFLGTIGTEGDGPREITRPVAMSATSGSITILDFAKHGTISFDRNGEFIETRRLDIEFGSGRIGHLDGDLLIGTLENYRSQKDSVFEQLMRIRPSGTHESMAKVARSRPKLVEYPDCVSIPFDPLFAPSLRWASSGSRVAVVTGVGYSIRVFDGTEDAWILRRRLAPRPIDAQIALREIGDGKTVKTPSFSCRIEPEDELRGRGFHEALPVVDKVSVSPSGRIWVKRSALRDEVPWIDIFDTDGEYLGSLSAPEDVFPDAFVSDSLILVKTVDELDVAHVTAYRVVERGAQ